MRPSIISGTVAAVLVAFSTRYATQTTVDKTVVTGGKNEPPFIVEIVAKGVPEGANPDAVTAPTNDDSDSAKGFDMWLGAKIAYDELNENLAKESIAKNQPPEELAFKPILKNDKNKESEATSFAKSIDSNPRVLAVIGHGVSNTTRPAATIYDQFKIPTVIPFATWKLATVAMGTGEDNQPDGRRLESAFRLPPSDGHGQAPALVYEVLELVRTNSAPAPQTVSPNLVPAPQTVVHLECSNADPNDAGYTKPLCDDVEKLLTAKGLSDVDRQDVNNWPDAAQEILKHQQKNSNKAGVVIFCGYSAAATGFLKALDAAYAANDTTKNLKPPKLVFAATAFGIEDTPLESDKDDPSKPAPPFKLKTTFETFSVGQIDLNECRSHSPKWELLKEKSKSYKPGVSDDARVTQAQVLGYDAMMVLGKASLKCKGKLSRECLTSELNNADDSFKGACGFYTFKNGENASSNYYIFEKGTKSTKLVPDDLNNIRSTGDRVSP